MLVYQACGQQLKQIQKGTAANQIPVTNGPQYTQVYRNAVPYILDSLHLRDTIVELLSAGGGGTVISVNASAGTGISVSGGPITSSGTINVVNTLPDVTVSLTDGGITEITGAYPNFTITSTELDGDPDNEIQYLTILDSINRVFRLQLSDGNTIKWKDTDTNSGGTVTNIATSGPITGGPITGAGTIGLDTTSATGAGTQYDLTLKQDKLISGTNIKTVNSNSLLGSGNVSVGTVTAITATAPLTGGTINTTGSIGVDTTSITGLGTQYDLTLKQATLISGTNIKTINGNTLLGSGDLSIGGLTGSGVATRLAFWNGTSSLSSNANLYWDNTNSRLGINNASPSYALDANASIFNSYAGRIYNSGTGDRHGLLIQSDESSSGRYPLRITTAGATDALVVNADGTVGIGVATTVNSIFHLYAASARARLESSGTNQRAEFNFVNPAKNISWGLNPDGAATNWFGMFDNTHSKYPIRVNASGATTVVNWAFGATEVEELNVNGGLQVQDLVGSGTRMVTTTDAGVLGSAAIPVGTVTNIATAGPITGGPITGAGTIGLDTVSATGAATQYDLMLKQDKLISGTNIKTVNSNSLLGSGNVSVGTVTAITATAPLTGGTINTTGSIGVDTTSTTGLGTQYDLTLKQATLISGTNIKTINGNTLLGSGDLTIGGSGTVTNIATTDGITGGPITGTGTLGLTGQALALHNLGTTGIVARTGAAAFSARTITAGTGISITNGNGVAGNPTINNTGMTSLNGSTSTSQTFAIGTASTDFNIATSGFEHTFNLPTASASNRGALSSADWTTFNGKMGGTGAAGKVAFYTGAKVLSSNTDFHWSNSLKRLAIGRDSAHTVLHVAGSNASGNGILMQNKQTVATNLISQHILSIGSGTGFSSTEIYYALKNTATSSSAGDFSIGYWNGGTEASRFKINSTGNVQIPFLQGTGTRMVVTDGSGWIDSQLLPTGTVSSIATGNGITGGTITTSGTLELTGQALALHNLGTTGIVVRTGAAAFSTRTITGSTGIIVTNGNGVTSDPTIRAASSDYSTLEKPTTIASQTYDATYRNVDFDAQGGNMTQSISNNNITVTDAGVYSITFSSSYYASSTARLGLLLYINGSASGTGASVVTQSHNSTDYYNISKTFTINLGAGAVLDYKFSKQSGTDGTITFVSPVLVVQRIY
jgi:hypothetical protein